MSEESATRKTSIQTILLTGIVSLIVGVGSGVLINYLTVKQPKLIYDITTQEVFPGQQNNIGIFAIRISNDGKREIENLLCHLKFPGGKITERKITGIPNSAMTIAGAEHDIEVSSPFLNPKESFSIQVLLSDIKQPFPSPVVEVRGKGVLGSEAQSDSRSHRTLSEIFSLAIAALATLLTAFSTFRFRIMRQHLTIKEVVNPSHHSADQRDTIAFTLETNGLHEDAQIIREWPRKITYWAASDALCYKWLKSEDQDRIKNGLNSMELLINYAAIADDSQRIIHLNMAKLALALKDYKLTNKYITLARSKKDAIIEKRILANSDLRNFSEEHGPTMRST